ncbi:MAG: HAD family hydrolase [Bryobacterales bacterium]|nr:HAD family hydrolase [Bryobacteraceae bacterium]MDW8129474.1 HAD family hydrolase [Bryobacterales bacterium]
MKPAVFLDRDGVLVRERLVEGKPLPPLSAAEMEIVAAARSALQQLRACGFRLVVVTNQPDVARGLVSPGDIRRMHERLRAELPLDAIYACMHDDADGCDCRKPKPGLLLQAARELGLDLSRSFMVGDRWRDVEAGRAAGCRTVWIDRGYRERPPLAPPDARVESLEQAVAWILSETRKGEARDDDSG